VKRGCIIIAPALLAGAMATLLFATLAFARPLAAPPAITTVTPASAIAGQAFTIVIAGANFEPTSTVTLNSIALAVSGATTDTITATASAGAFTAAGSFTLSVGTPEGTATTSFKIAPATPQLSVAPPGAVTIDAGGSVPFIATVADIYGNSVTTDTVQWSSSTGAFLPNAGNTTTFTPPTAPAAYLISATLQSTSQVVQRQVTVQAGPATQITLQPATSPINVVAGSTVLFTATLLDAANNPTTNGTVSWIASVGGFSGSGLSRTYAPPTTAGTTLVTATLVSNGVAQGRQVIVSPAAASSMSIAPSASSITAGGSAWFTATVRDSFNNIIASDVVTWSKVSGPGTLTDNPPRSATLTTGAGTGTTSVQANYPGIAPASATIAVIAGNPAQLSIAPLNPSMTAGGSIAFTALVSDSFGNVTSAGNVTWTVFSGPGALSNKQSRSATFTSTVAAPSVVRAQIAGAPDATTTVTVNPAGIARITLTPANATLPVNASINFSAAAFDTYNNAIPNAAFAWSSADTTKATVIAGGNTATLTAKTTAGTFASLLRVNSASITQTATITITPGAPSSIVLAPPAATLVVSTTQAFGATVLDAYGNSVPNTALVWSVSGAQVGQIAATSGNTAIFTASTVAGVYPAGVRVSTGSITQTANITLTAGALSVVTLNPNGITISPTGSSAIVATGRDRFGNPINGLSFNWSVNGGAGSITPAALGSPNAIFDAGIVAGNYPNAISATAQGFTGRANVLITTDQVARIDVSPASAALQPTAQQIFFARGYDRFNNLIWPLEVSWGVTGTGLITKTGSVTATFEAGTIARVFTDAVSASTQGITGTASITVNAGPLSSIKVDPAVVVIGIGSQQPFNAAGFDAWGNPVPNFSANWSIAPASAGSFDATTATSALFRAGTTPNTYNNGVRASSGAVSGAASVVVKAGTVAAVSLSPTSASLPIAGVQIFTAAVLDGAGNPLPDLSVVWQVAPNAGTIVSSGPLTAAVKAGTSAGAFAGAVRASNGVFSAVADVTVQAGAASGMSINAAPGTLQTNGADSSAIEVVLTDAFGNATGAGSVVQWEIVQCSGECALESASSQADASGHARTAIRSNHRAPQGTTSTIIVRAVAGGLSKTVTLAGQFAPFVLRMPLLLRDAPLNNHSVCTALRIAPPQTVQQPADNAFNIYRFTAIAPSLRISLASFGTSGRMLLYRIAVDKCATSGTMTVVYLGEAGITSPTSFDTAFNNLLTPGQSYLLAVNTTGAFTSQPYTITVQP
jgi:hypothetical protein